MGAVLMGLSIFLGPFLGDRGWRYIALAILILAGLLSYYGFGRTLGAFSLAEMRSALRRS